MNNQKDIERLFRQNYERMFLTARMLLCDEEEARDVVSDIFASLIINRNTSIEMNEAAYLLRAVRNKCLNIINHRILKVSAIKEIRSYATDDDLPYEELPLEDILNYIDTHLERKTSDIVTMRYERGMSFKEIGQETGISRTAINKKITKALQTLKNHFSTANEHKR